jgi:hypothetical protein
MTHLLLKQMIRLLCVPLVAEEAPVLVVVEEAVLLDK